MVVAKLVKKLFGFDDMQKSTIILDDDTEVTPIRTQMSDDDLAGWLHINLAFFLNRYAGDEIASRESIYALSNLTWSQISTDKEYEWAYEWLIRVARQLRSL